MAHINAKSVDHVKKKELQSKGIKTLLKLLSLKYLSQASLEERNRNPSSLKCLHFINSFVIVSKEKEIKKENKEEFAKETKKETKEEEEDDLEYFDMFFIIDELRYHEWILKNPRPPWVSAKIRTRNMDNIKIECMVGQFLKKQTYINLESPINVMSRLNYYWIMSEGLKSRRKLSSPKKIANFIGRVKGFKVFIGNFAYECEFVILEDTTSVIDHYLGGMVLGKPFVKETRLVYDKENECILQEVTNRIVCRNFFQENECEIFTEAGDGVRIIPDGVRLYFMRRSLEVLREFPVDDS
uniref:Retrotransposon Orf1 n=1 Tax=Tanacetum cinerariifolium TaxID=118510 RepID=A0A6L2NYQ2_TANCI|nr:retrotransposon Orf1 [Tanacetum cinerariifolium]